MPRTAIIFFRDGDRTPFLDWFEQLPDGSKVQCRARLGLLAEQGPQLRRPAADYLRDGIYELRARARGVRYRMLYFFHGRLAVVISHGIVKKGAVVPPVEITRAIWRKRRFEADPSKHSHQEPQ